jgi:hypothetical protein
MILAGSVVGLAGYAFAGGANSTPAPDRSQAIDPQAVARRRREDEEGDGTPVPDSIHDPVAIAVPDSPNEPDRRPDATVLSPNMQEALDLIGNQPRVLSDDDGNPLHFAQATSDGVPRTDGSGNVRDRGVGENGNPNKPLPLDPEKQKAYEKLLKGLDNFIEPYYIRIKNASGELVFSKDQIEAFQKQSMIVINGKVWSREKDPDYFSSNESFKDGKQHKIKITAEGRIKEITIDPKTGIQKTSTYDLNGEKIQPIVSNDEPSFLESNRKFNEKIESVKENPTLQDYKSNPSKKDVLRIFEKAADGSNMPALLGSIENIGKKLIMDAIYEYDTTLNSKGKTKDLLQKLIKDNGLDLKDATPEQKTVKSNLEKLYNDLYKKYETGKTKENKSFQTDKDKREFMTDRINYMREEHNRLTTELLAKKYKDNIDLENSSEKFTILKDGGGVILNQVFYDSQMDNETNIWFNGKDYNLRPGNQCSPTSAAMVMEYLGARGIHGNNQLVDDIIAEGIKAGIVKKGKELQNIKQIEQLIANYGLEQKVIKPDGLTNPSRADNIKAQINAGKPVVTSGTFNIQIGNNKDGDPIIVKGHVITIVGYDETGWIVHDPYGDANSDYKKGSGKYVHYDFGKWNIGNSEHTYTMSIPEATKP